MNRKRRKAIKMFKRKYGKATNPHWQARPVSPETQAASFAALGDALRRLYDGCR